jgi:hypothetical protein
MYFSRSASAAPIMLMLLVSTASAQGVRPLAPCMQSQLIFTTWQAVFAPQQDAGGRAPGNIAFACPMRISLSGAISFGTCTAGLPDGTVPQPSGTLTIDRTCNITGTISYSVCSATYFGGCVPRQISVSLWRSGDGTRPDWISENNQPERPQPIIHRILLHAAI